MPSRPFAALLLAAHLGCGAPAKPCPPGTVADGERSRALLTALRGTHVGHGLAGDDATICFGGLTRGTVSTDGVVRLPAALDSAAAAARLAHLRLHIADGLHHFPAADLPCDRQLAAALAAEARGIVAEIEACAELECDPAPYTFATSVLATKPTARLSLVIERLQAEPEADGLGVLVQDYRTRCKSAE